MQNKKADQKYWWGWLIWVPVSVAIGFYGTTLQGGSYNINQVVFLLALPAILINSALRQQKDKPTHFLKSILFLVLALLVYGAATSY